MTKLHYNANGCTLLMLFLLLAGCAGTRTLPVTEQNVGLLGIPPHLAQKNIALTFDTSDTEINGAYHDGLLQVPQPWNFGPSGEQEDKLYDHLETLTILSITDELQQQGLHIDIRNDDDAATIDLRKNQLLLNCKIQKIVLNTYGEYAGNYWDATLDIQVQLTALEDGRKILDKRIHEYAKLKPSPIIADLMKTMSMILPETLSRQPLRLLSKDYSEVYHTKDYQRSPAEVAGRYAAKDIIKEVMKLEIK